MDQKQVNSNENETNKWSATAHLNIKPQILFAYMADFTSTRNWDPHVIDASLKTPGPIQVGSQFSLAFRVGPKTTHFLYEVTKLEAPHLIELTSSADQYTIKDTMTIKQDPANKNGSVMTYSLDLEQKNPNLVSVKIGKTMINYFANKALRSLKRLALADTSKTQMASTVLDKAIIPGMYQFTRFGFFGMKKDQHPIPAATENLKMVLTGATAGIGREIAIELARSGVELIIVNRTQSKANQLKQELEQRFDAKVHSYIADMSDIKTVVQMAQTLIQDHPQIDGLINNAGELLNERRETQEGYDHNFAVLLLAPFALTQECLPALQASNPNRQGPSRVINMCSGGLYTQGIYLEDLQYTQGEYNGAKAYARAKRGLLDCTEHSSRVVNKDTVVFHAMHPGWVHTPGVEKSLASFLKVTKPVLRTPFQGADTALWLALSRTAGQSSGLFWLDRKAHTTSIFPKTKTHPTEQAQLFEMLMELYKKAKIADNEVLSQDTPLESKQA